MKCTDYIIPKNSHDTWIIIYSEWKNHGSISVERINVNSSFAMNDVMCIKKFAKKEDFVKELEKQRGDWNACVSTGKQAVSRAAYRFLPKI